MNEEDPLVQHSTPLDDAICEQADAAVLDLGSNSFHLLLGRWHPTGWRQLAHRGEKVQLAAELGMGGDITPAALTRACDALRRLAPALRRLPADRVAIVGTQALRVARNSAEFIARAEQLLGHTVTVLSGVEEARLVFAATAARADDAAAGEAGRLPGTEPRRMVVDVGGASTELATGRGGRVEAAMSVPVGCLTWRRYFADGELVSGTFQQAYGAACELFASHARPCGDETLVVGCSGTLQALEQVLIGQGWGDGGIDRAGLIALHEALLRFDHIDAVAFDGLTESRRTIFAAGTAVVMALFDTLDIDHMSVSSRSLRHGLMERLWRDHHRHAGSVTTASQVA